MTATRLVFALSVALVSPGLGEPVAHAFVPPSFGASTVDLSGTYSFTGTEPDGTPEPAGIARVSRLAPNVYSMVEEAGGQLQSAARCLRQGDVLVCGWNGGATSDAGCGILAHKADGTYEGSLLEVAALTSLRTRATSAGGPIYTLETFADGLPRPFGVVNLYDGDRGIVVTLKAPSARGMSLRDGDTLFVSFGGPGSVGVVFYRIQGRTLSGRWVDSTRSGVGTEVLVRQ